jgi:hypothetical protein
MNQYEQAYAVHIGAVTVLVVEAAAEKPFPNERLVTREANGKTVLEPPAYSLHTHHYTSTSKMGLRWRDG